MGSVADFGIEVETLLFDVGFTCFGGKIFSDVIILAKFLSPAVEGSDFPI